MKKFKWKDTYSFYLMLLIPAVLVFIYCYIPMAGIVIAFYNYKPALGLTGSQFIGLEHFKTLSSNPQFANALKNTIIIAWLKIFFNLTVPLVVSLLLNEVRNAFFKRVTQTLVYLPHFISWVLMSGIILDFLASNGEMNRIIQMFGGDPVLFMVKEEYFKPVVIITEVWKSFGWGTIIYMATLTGIDPNLYEAAAIDGAGRWKQTIHITLPGMASVIVLNATLSLSSVLNAGFEQIFNLMSPVTMEAGDIIDTLVYRLGMEAGDFGMSTAVGLFKSIVSAVFIIVSYALAYKFTGYRVF